MASTLLEAEETAAVEASAVRDRAATGRLLQAAVRLEMAAMAKGAEMAEMQ